ncbi:uncharacterized protein LOC126181958 isoform X2 [Schistocerca cancellata]|uniref:uncharacterized protein LOC126181958 isoform X2 n=1 Tax=Schistocerca cancellata TaxID=274614 RepID=UPI002118B317|nr:uncharacterized protein LOC126181958 isoform X2 [Schistocerca cancellata]
MSMARPTVAATHHLTVFVDRRRFAVAHKRLPCVSWESSLLTQPPPDREGGTSACLPSPGRQHRAILPPQLLSVGPDFDSGHRHRTTRPSALEKTWWPPVTAARPHPAPSARLGYRNRERSPLSPEQSEDTARRRNVCSYDAGISRGNSGLRQRMEQNQKNV